MLRPLKSQPSWLPWHVEWLRWSICAGKGPLERSQLVQRRARRLFSSMRRWSLSAIVLVANSSSDLDGLAADEAARHLY